MPKIGVSGSDFFWQEISALALVDTFSGQPLEQATTVQMAWDEREWRIRFTVTDAHAWATITERDGPLYREEVVEVFVDPYGDLFSYFEIEVNPLNTVCDLVLRKNRSGIIKDFGWHCEGLVTTVQRTSAGWIAELGIPFASIADGAPQPGSVWRANFLRIDRPAHRERELGAWSPTGVAQFHVPARFGFVEFTE
ncbi:MAG: carbohydrate-binding family 9-like protein [Chthoniobacteraceae bacterium]